MGKRDSSLRWARLGGLAASAVLGGCSGISECGEDEARCAQMLNENGAACAEAFTFKQSHPKRKACADAIHLVGRNEVKEAVPGLLAVLAVPVSGVPEDDHKAEAARALGRIGAKEAVEPLMAAIEFGLGTSADPKDRMGNRDNEKIAEALGLIGDDRAVPKLLELKAKSPDNNVKLWAMRALGRIGSPEAAKALTRMALGDPNKFMRKNAVMALGDIGTAETIPALIQMMFVELEGVSFYREASYALFQVGAPAVEPLLETLALKNPEVDAIFERSGGMKESAVVAKSAIVLGDLRDPRAVEPLIAAYEKAMEKNDPVILREVAFALGALQDERAVPVLMKNMAHPDASLRERIMESLNKIGDRRPVPEMIEAVTEKDFVKRCVKEGASKSACEQDMLSRAGAQKAAADMVTHLVDAERVDALEQVFMAESQPELKTYFLERFEAAKLAKTCGEDANCWADKAKSKNELIREKAYWELGRIGGPKAQEVLAKGLSDKKRKARAAAIFSYWKVGDKSVLPALEKQLEDEKGQADFIVVNEDLKRLFIGLERS